MKLTNWMSQDEDVRRAHIDLSTPCIIGTGTISKEKILEFFGITEDDVPDWRKGKVQRCHVCKCNSKSGTVCSNPLHIYLGPQPENEADKNTEPPEPTDVIHLEVPGVGQYERTEEMRRKQSELLTGKKLTEEQRERQLAAIANPDPEVEEKRRLRISQAQRGKKRGPYKTRAKEWAS